ncbi:MAG: metal ABC transporter substrate-binding protein [Lachnospiraceae bacterium]|nr:metal ABC transporter substrate-binding protein [Lachnospiraceae bacterium]
MKSRIKYFGILSFIISAIFLICGCESKTEAENGTTIVCTIFPVYDWCREITAGCENVNVILLEDNGTDMHSYQPTVKDFADMEDCDVFIFIGGESEEWVEEFCEEHQSTKRTDICLMDEISDYVLTENSEGIISAEHDEENEEENDEHIWLSLKRSMKCVEVISGKIKEKTIDKEQVEKNTVDYINKLSQLNDEYENYFASQERMLVVADRFPFRYLAEDYNISYIAAFPGCSSEVNTSFETVAGLADGLKNSNEKTVYITESGDSEFARTIINESGKNGSIKTLDSIQTVNKSQIAGGISYYELMKKNLEIIKEQ